MEQRELKQKKYWRQEPLNNKIILGKMIKLFHGKDQFLSLRAAKKLFFSLIENVSNTESIEIDAESSDLSQIIESYETHGMFSSSKVILIKRLLLCKEYPKFIEHISSIESIDDSVTIIFWESKKIPSNTKYIKLISKIGEVTESPDLNKRNFLTWAKNELKEEQIDIDLDALNELVKRCNYNAERFSSEISKFKVLAKKIDLSTVKAYVVDSFESDIWQLVDSINIGDRANYLKILENLLKNNLEPHYILAMMYRNLRLMAQIKYLKDNNTENRQIASILKIPPFTIPSLSKNTDRFNMSTIGRLYEKLANLDYQVKIGEIAPEMGLTLISTLI